jgi:hypothetical protein
MLRLARALLALPCLLAWPTAPTAAQSKSALSWVRTEGAEQCIGSVELGKRVERLVGPMLVAAPEGQVSVEGRIAAVKAPGARGFVAEIVIADASGKILGTRQLKSEHDDCRAIDDKLAFVIAVAIDPNAALAELPGELSQEDDPGATLLAELNAGAQPPAPSAVSSDAAAPKPAPAEPARVQSARDPGPPLQLRVALEPALGLGNLPGPAAGAQLGIGVAFGEVALWLRGSAWLPQDEAAARGDAYVQVGAFGLALAVCPLALRSGRWSGTLCAGAGLDRLMADPSGFAAETETPQHSWILGPELELRAGLQASPSWWLGLSAAVLARFPRRDIGYTLDGQWRSVYRTPDASGRLGAVVELRF